jgi:hypothetical protein
LALGTNPGDIISFERGQKTTLVSNFSFHLAIVPSVNPILNKQQTHDYFMAHLFVDPPQSPLFCPQNLNILRTKLRASPQEILHSCHYKESSYVKILNSFLPIECTIIGHSQRKIHKSKFQSWKGQQLTFCENFDFTLVIVSNLDHVDSLSHLKRKTCEEKLTTKRTINKQL